MWRELRLRRDTSNRSPIRAFVSHGGQLAGAGGGLRCAQHGSHLTAPPGASESPPRCRGNAQELVQPLPTASAAPTPESWSTLASDDRGTPPRATHRPDALLGPLPPTPGLEDGRRVKEGARWAPSGRGVAPRGPLRGASSTNLCAGPEPDPRGPQRERGAPVAFLIQAGRPRFSRPFSGATPETPGTPGALCLCVNRHPPGRDHCYGGDRCHPASLC